MALVKAEMNESRFADPNAEDFGVCLQNSMIELNEGGLGANWSIDK